MAKLSRYREPKIKNTDTKPLKSTVRNNMDFKGLFFENFFLDLKEFSEIYRICILDSEIAYHLIIR